MIIDIKENQMVGEDSAMVNVALKNFQTRSTKEAIFIPHYGFESHGDDSREYKAGEVVDCEERPEALRGLYDCFKSRIVCVRTLKKFENLKQRRVEIIEDR